MKKFFLFILILFSYSNIFAYEYSQWSVDYPTEIKEDIIESNEMCLWYKDEITDIEYLKKEDFKDKEYDLNDFIITDLSEESIFMPDLYEDRVIQSTTKSVYSTIDDIDHISIKGIEGEIFLSEITIYDSEKGEYIDFEFEERYKDTYNYSHLNNGIFDDYEIANNDSVISINLGKKYNAYNLTITLYYEAYDYVYWILYYDNGFMRVIEKAKGSYACDSCNYIYIYNPNDTYYFREFYRGKFYQYTDKLYKTYNYTKVYTEEYYSEFDEYVKDENTCKTFYRYIISEYIIYDILGNVVKDDKYCDKEQCFLEKNIIYIPKETHDFDNPKTLDNIDECIIICFVSLIVIICILIFFKKYDSMCHINN